MGYEDGLYTWICLRWFFTDCTMVNHHENIIWENTFYFFQFILHHLGDMRNIATIYHHLVYTIVCFGDLLGMKSYPVIVGMIVNHEIRITVKQPVFHGSYFCWGYKDPLSRVQRLGLIAWFLANLAGVQDVIIDQDVTSSWTNDLAEPKNFSRWWFQTLFIVTPTWGRLPFWRYIICFNWIGSTTN